MKKIVLLSCLVLSIFAKSQELKGYKLGSSINGAEASKLTTLGGISGVLSVDTLNNGNIYLVTFIPSEDGTTVTRIYSSDTDRLKEGLENKFNVKFKKSTKTYSDDYSLRATSGDVVLLISVKSNDFMDKPDEITIYFYSSALYSIKEKEKQEKANDDF